MATRHINAPQASPGLKNTTLMDEVVERLIQHDSPQHLRKLQRAEDRMRLVTLSDQVAGETLYTRSYKWDIGNKCYPEDIDAHMRFVTKFYPYTRSENPKQPGPPLYVDEPQNEKQVLECYEKQKHLKKKGLRHIVVEPRRVNPDRVDSKNGKVVEGSTLEASTLEELFEQLGE